MRAACNHSRSNQDVVIALSDAVAVLATSLEAAERLATAMVSALKARTVDELEDNCLLDLAVHSLSIPGVQQVETSLNSMQWSLHEIGHKTRT